jgi:ComF family protein
MAKTVFPQLVKRILNFVLPPRCPMTGQLVGEQGALDSSYWTHLTFIRKPMCKICGRPFGIVDDTSSSGGDDLTCGSCLRDPPIYASARAALLYDDWSAKMVLRFKYADAVILVPLFNQWLLQAGREQLAQCDMIIPVPLHRWRLLRRRYNQAALLSNALAKTSGLAHHPLLLHRNKATESQGQKTKAQREENMRGVFTIHSKDHDKVQGKKILLVDDVMTSGATVNACTKALLNAGAKEVHILTICRVAHAD